LQVAFDHPTEGFVFNDPAKVMLAFKISHCHSDDCGHVAIEVGGSQLARFDLTPNEYGEIRAHAMLPDLPNGDFVAAVKLVSPDGTPLGDEFHHDVGFSVNTEQPSPYLLEDWPARRRATIESMCSPSSDCSVTPDDDSNGTACSGRGRCVRGACVCEANWCGATCEHSILENSSYLPAVDPASAPARCIKSLWWNNASDLLADSLLGIARRSSCRHEQLLLFDVLRPLSRSASSRFHLI
jgi:hypothetical protein